MSKHILIVDDSDTCRRVTRQSAEDSLNAYFYPRFS
jgi:hypothetical protein